MTQIQADMSIYNKKSFMAPFYGWGSTASRVEPLRGGSLLFTTKFPEKISKNIYLLKIYEVFARFMLNWCKNKQSYWWIFGRIKSQTLIILACINLMILCCWKLSLLLWEIKIFTNIFTYCVKSIAKIQKPIQRFIANSSQKLLLEHSLQNIFNNYDQRNYSKRSLKTIIR